MEQWSSNLSGSIIRGRCPPNPLFNLICNVITNSVFFQGTVSPEPPAVSVWGVRGAKPPALYRFPVSLLISRFVTDFPFAYKRAIRAHIRYQWSEGAARPMCPIDPLSGARL